MTPCQMMQCDLYKIWDGKPKILADLFRFKIDIKLSQDKFLSFIASDFKKLVYSSKYFKTQWKVRLQREKNGIFY